MKLSIFPAICCGLPLILALLGTGALPAAEEAEEYVQVEVQGKLETGIAAIGGETTGTIIKANNIVWELDLGGKKELTELAEKLNKQAVVVSGRYTKKKGVEIPERHIVVVKSLRAAAKK